MKYLFFVLILFSFILPFAMPVSAHEVYVLDSHEIEFAMAQDSIDIVSVIKSHEDQFMLAVGFGTLLIVAILLFSVSKKVETHLDKYLMVFKKWAPIIAQFTLAVSLIASSYYGAIFGVELPFIKAFGLYAGFARILVSVCGFALLIGFLPRVASVFTILIFVPLFYKYGFYMSNYLTYFGEALTIMLFGSTYDIFSSAHIRPWWHINKNLHPQYHKYKYLIMRIFFGFSLIYAAVYAKYLHGALALETVAKYNLTSYFHFDALFLVLGALLVEIFLGCCFFFGFEIRFASIFFLVFLVASLLFFKEAVWPHFMLIGTAFSMFAHGYDKYTVTAKFWGREDLEPVL